MTTHDTAAGAARNPFAAVTPGWQTWDAQLVSATRPATDALLAAVGIAPGMQVLDVASGTGEPALRIAELVGPAGHVTATDAQAAMLSAAETKAQRAGLSNISFQVAGAAALAFPEDSFDAITCRMGVMFFPHQQALGVLRRLLKPGGRIGFAVWGPFERNVWMSALRAPVLRLSRVPVDPSAPDPFRYGTPGSLAADLRQAGFREVREEARRLIWSFPGTPEQFWEFQTALSGPYARPGWETLTAEQQAQAKADAQAALQPYQRGDLLDVPVELNVATAVR